MDKWLRLTLIYVCGMFLAGLVLFLYFIVISR